MANDALTKMSEQYQNFLAPVVRINQLSAANLETIVNFQTSALQAYVDIAISRLKAAAEISDPASLKAFLTGQAEAITSLQKKFMDDAKTLGEMATKFKADFDKLVQDSLPTGK